MKLSEKIKEIEKELVTSKLKENGYKQFYNEYAPFSMFFTKDMEDNKTLYVRRDIEDFRSHDVWSFEIWERDNNKHILDKNIDTQHRKYNCISSMDKLIEQIRR